MSEPEFSLERLQESLTDLGDPHLHCKVIHVAGTNGKGSVCAAVASMLGPCGIGLRCGLFTSPHLVHPSDSIRVDGVALTKQYYAELQERITRIPSAARLSPFELLVETAFVAFRELNVEIAVLEVGVGGRFDATNVVPLSHTLCSVVTHLDIDHVGWLGDTIDQIAWHKVGIVKGGLVIVGRQKCEYAHDIRSAVDEQCRKTGAEAVYLDETHTCIDEEGGLWRCTRPNGFEVRFKPPLNGDFQRDNLAIAMEVCYGLISSNSLPKIVTTNHLSNGIEATRWPGRLEWIQVDEMKQPFLVDGAHNASAARVLDQYVATVRDSPVCWIVAFTKGKAVDEVLSILLREGDTVLAVPFTQPEGMPWVECVLTRDIIAAIGINVTMVEFNTLDEALRYASKNQAATTVLGGSLYLVADLYRHLKKEP